MFPPTDIFTHIIHLPAADVAAAVGSLTYLPSRPALAPPVTRCKLVKVWREEWRSGEEEGAKPLRLRP